LEMPLHRRRRLGFQSLHESRTKDIIRSIVKKKKLFHLSHLTTLMEGTSMCRRSKHRISTQGKSIFKHLSQLLFTYSMPAEA
jgi:hypothetical protein